MENEDINRLKKMKVKIEDSIKEKITELKDKGFPDDEIADFLKGWGTNVLHTIIERNLKALKDDDE